MLQYGFCFADNMYDSYEFYIKLDASSEVPVSELIDFTCQSRDCQKILLKPDQINAVLAAYIRSRNKQKFFEVKGSMNVMQNIFFMPDVLLSRPTNIEFEKLVFQEYMEILQIINTNFMKHVGESYEYSNEEFCQSGQSYLKNSRFNDQLSL